MDVFNENTLRCLNMQDRSVAFSNPLQLNMIVICTNDGDNIFVCDSKSVYEVANRHELGKFFHCTRWLGFGSHDRGQGEVSNFNFCF